MNGIDLGTVIVTALFTALLVRLFGGGPSQPANLGRLEAKVDALLKHFGIEFVVETAPSPAVVELAKQGKKIEAIRLYRSTAFVGLKEAKDVVDAIERQSKQNPTG